MCYEILAVTNNIICCNNKRTRVPVLQFLRCVIGAILEYGRSDYKAVELPEGNPRKLGLGLQRQERDQRGMIAHCGASR